MNTTQQTITLREFWSTACDRIVSVFYTLPGWPLGAEHFANTSVDLHDPEFCDPHQVIDSLKGDGWSLNGTIKPDGSWRWDGKGPLRDKFNAEIYRFEVRVS